MKRILLFLATNLAIIVVLSITLRLLGFERILDANGVDLNMNSLLLFASVFGFGGSFISLAISKWMAKKTTGAKVITQASNPTEKWLVDTVSMQAKAAGIGMPEVAIYPGKEVNAFATGANRNNALVAVSAGLLNNMTKDEAEAVLAHEVSHVANGDMITLSLIQGVVNTFVIFFSRVIGHTIDRVVFKNERGHGIAYWVSTIIAEIVLSILASTIVMWFSRQREYRADAGGAKLAGTHKMIAALKRLQAQTESQELPDQLTAFGISGLRHSKFGALFLSHPPLEQRIQALEQSMARN
ncbi:zinc metalloprotease HtpX [Oleiphilus sp. HI0009]|uniref:protease HtpX n=1 Tax=unclassified Oleiphilus TaxID=2631174 RepID=UPI0007C2A44C|nr:MULTISPECIES: protease HtpX [unclassified Oleiphilus]KZX74945.1 zinc metalloprotease HtpX [Oleiphilus sp. HI0009]MCH2159204.1 protease HtpX [Oleiphilaceae bacterium]KZY69473.1 zinc metalloprotease HtpX [Oleiphilus sp. HI0066]KZY72030.1 zinc metalloprotease HtpX [Oleiphilus sp. HI0067]KZZ60693.1 zinc metalloprotease HtpX [Oleiphilus sp. HI0125]